VLAANRNTMLASTLQQFEIVFNLKFGRSHRNPVFEIRAMIDFKELRPRETRIQQQQQQQQQY